jgi:hypothetical protein
VEMSSLPLYPSLVQQLITHPLSAVCFSTLCTHPLSGHLHFQSLFTESLNGDQLLVSPPSPVHSEHPAPLLHVPFQFLMCYSGFIFLVSQGSDSVQGAELVYPKGGCGSTYRMPLICSPFGLCLPGRFGASVWQRGIPSVFSA